MSLISSVIQSTSNVDMNLNCLCQEEQNNRIDSQDSAEVSKKINTHKHRTLEKIRLTRTIILMESIVFSLKTNFQGFYACLFFFL